MSESPKQVWLHTLPGIITSITGLLAAITGFLALLYQQGILGDPDKSSKAKDTLNIAGAVSAAATAPDDAAQEILAISCANIVNARFSISQENGLLVKLHVLSQSGNVFTGLAQTDVSGKFSGVIAANTVQFTVDWSNDSTGVYAGEIGQDRALAGHSYDLKHPESQARFSGDFPCSGL